MGITGTDTAISGKQKTGYAGSLLVCTLIWGGGFVFVRMALNAGLSPAGVELGRFALASVVLSIFCMRPIKNNYRPGQWAKGGIIGLFMFGGFFLQTIGMQHTTPANSAFITGTYVVIVPIIVWVFTKKRPSLVIFAACLLSLTGVGILSLNFSQGFSFALGDGITLLAAMLFAGQIVAMSYLARTMHPLVLVYTQIIAAAICSLIAFLIMDRNFAAFFNLSAAAPLAYISILSTCFCYFLQTRAQRFLPPATVGMLLATESVFGAMFSVLTGYDKPNIRMFIGGFVMFAAVLLPEVWTSLKKEASPKSTK